MEMNESHVGTQRQYTHAHTCTANKEISFFFALYLLTLRTLKTVCFICYFSILKVSRGNVAALVIWMVNYFVETCCCFNS